MKFLKWMIIIVSIIIVTLLFFGYFDHSIDFATSVIPGWHTTIFPPYFIAGTILTILLIVLIAVFLYRKFK